MPIDKAVKETRLWKWLRDGGRQYYKHNLHISRIENSIMSGMPDVEGCLSGQQFWIELKCTSRPSNVDKTTIKCRFQPEQLPWLKTRVRAGGKAFVLVQVGSGANACRYLIPGNSASYILAKGNIEAKLNEFSACGPHASAATILLIAANYADF